MKKFLCKIICGFVPVKRARRKVKEWFGVRVPVVVREYYGKRKIYDGEGAQQKVFEVLKSGKPCLIARFGGTEYSAFEQWLEIKAGKRKNYSEKIQKNIALQAGFPADARQNQPLFPRVGRSCRACGHYGRMVYSQ